MLDMKCLQHEFIFVPLLVLITVISSCAPAGHQHRAESPSTALPDVLHESKGNDAKGTAESSSQSTDDSTACLSCHDYRENHHPTDFVPADASKFPFPLYDGRVRCLTCHNENHMGSPFMLRGGPYTDRREICFQCHYEEEYRYIYPHIMLDDKEKFLEVNGRPVCLVCHLKTPDPTVDRTKDVVFRADVAFLCLRCHSLMAKAILNRHVLLKPSLEMLTYLEQNEQKLSVTIPLVPRDRITCSTCHNPHQIGVIIYEPSAKGADAPDRLRVAEPALCVVCHVM
ncbi:exported hypothetical protein [Candidatus Sulfobium mesophilum]|uniref:Doubled CXXCH motif domain-containing protein n=1 Tax=Candidatus Sulfobium mesophilum TaxID=2016548 RepID=A0A2U3QL72_9BACT|nr:exported hypothetical protein [Candidatus Sulfobium mesophilum]